MQVHHDTSVLISDGRKALLIKNHGDTDFPDLRLVKRWEEGIPANRELKSDAPGRTFSSHEHGMRRSSYEEGDLHAQAEARFAAEVADYFNAQDLEDELVIVAPPRTLGELRKYLGSSVLELVTAEIAKDLVKHPIWEIERMIARYSESA